MTHRGGFLKIRLEGKRVGRSSVPVSCVVRLFREFDKAVSRTAALLLEESGSVSSKLPGKDIEQLLALDLIAVSEGSLATVLEFARSSPQPGLPSIDFGTTVFETVILGLGELQESTSDRLPDYVDKRILQAWADLGQVFRGDVDEIGFTLDGGRRPVSATYNQQGRTRIEGFIVAPRVDVRVVEGFIRMVDFGRSLRCRVHPLIGTPIACTFREEQQDQVLASVLRYARVKGEAKLDPVTNEVSSIAITEIVVPDEDKQSHSRTEKQESLSSKSFWASQSIEELARAQNLVGSVNLDQIVGTWPGDVDDGFEEDVIKLRLGQKKARG